MLSGGRHGSFCPQGYRLEPVVTNGAIVIHTQRLKSDPGGNLLS
ncbi:chemotaxis protein [Escherichia coli]|nr:chemotaxis protein [Escherichia coli]